VICVTAERHSVVDWIGERSCSRTMNATSCPKRSPGTAES
jgi:hypothetical protein